MRRTERVLVYSTLVVALAALVGQAGGLGLVRSAAANPAGAPPVVEAAKLATCDIYQLVERMVESDQYKPAQVSEQERVKTQLKPMEDELEREQKELQAADPKEPGAQEKFRKFQSNREEYVTRRQAAADGYSDLVASQFAEAYGKVCIETKKVANSLGYGYVMAQKKGEIKAHNPQQLVEEFLSRHVPVAPDGVDITEQVRAAMKLPEKAATPSASVPDTAPAGTSPTTETPKK